MIEQKIEIRTPDGTSDGMMYHSQDHRRLVGLIFLTDIGGIRPSQREMAQRLAAQGYSVLLPNVFYRVGRPPVIDFPVKIGEEQTIKRIGELSGSLTPEAAERDASAYLGFLSDHELVADHPIGVVGYCFSGALAMRIAAAEPDRVAAAASFHGGRLFTDDPASPHLLLPRIKAQLYFGHATQDRSMPPEAIQKLDQALQAWGGKYQSEVYESAYHGWTVPDSPAYNHPQAERAFEKLKEFFAGVLGRD
ncbi:MAG: dienelactone hydrolase family protein [Verrucomicrobia bacterium]|nr:dienelactone hydrolase family protein [Verrucomicrobiota bacterium]